VRKYGFGKLDATAGLRYVLTGAVQGDVNADGRVNVSDVTALINCILGITEGDAMKDDVNGDGRLNVSDVAALVNIILGL
ncbi:MAG: dockerin type I repeat-containing protein, partial [Muribaculaceae bacterium]|nr:dockerin type I repeat-containing protein [Muribaculaceae bacterium]